MPTFLGLDQTCPPDPGLDGRLSDGRLYPYQVEGARWLASRTHGLLSDQMGLGKSAMAILAIPDGWGAVVVAPASVQAHWTAEVAKWRPDLVAVEVDRASFRWPAPGEVVIARWSSLPRAKTWERNDYPLWTPCDTVAILDEAHLASNPGSARPRSAYLLAHIARRVWLLSGTPLVNTPEGLWSVLGLADLGWPFGAMGDFLAMVERDTEGRALRVAPGFDALLGKVMLRRRKEEVLSQLPPKRFDILPVPVEAPEIVAMLDGVLDAAGGEEHVLAALHGALGAAERLRVETILSRARRALAEVKMPALLELVAELEREEERVVVFSCHRAPVENLSRRAGWQHILGSDPRPARVAAMEAFRRDGRGLAMTTAGAEGITLHCDGACATMIRVDLDWRPGINAQVADRIHRVGQTRAVWVVDLVADHRVDHIVHEVLGRKGEVLRSAGLG